MSILSALSFAAAMLVLALTPGPGVFAVLGRALHSGFRKSLFLIAGIVTGDLTYLTFALTGLTWVARNVGGVFTVIRILGGLYLIFLGIKAFLSTQGSSDSQESCEIRSNRACYLEGLLITLSNPKVILFYCSFLPAFMNLKEIAGGGFLTLALITCGTISLVLTSYSLLAVQGSKSIRSKKRMDLLNKGAGGLMVTAGSIMVLKR
jgi:threonine/homoserine/homoserine lactone efflux protein